jgi:hypothetical protein
MALLPSELASRPEGKSTKKCLNTVTALLSHSVGTWVARNEVYRVVGAGELDWAVECELVKEPSAAARKTMVNYDEGPFSFLDVLQILQQRSKGKHEDSRIISEVDIAMLKSIAETTEHRCRSL